MTCPDVLDRDGHVTPSFAVSPRYARKPQRGDLTQAMVTPWELGKKQPRKP